MAGGGLKALPQTAPGKHGRSGLGAGNPPVITANEGGPAEEEKGGPREAGTRERRGVDAQRGLVMHKRRRETLTFVS